MTPTSEALKQANFSEDAERLADNLEAIADVIKSYDATAVRVEAYASMMKAAMFIRAAQAASEKATAAERERCAQVADACRSLPSQEIDEYGTTLAKYIAALIRKGEAA